MDVKKIVILGASGSGKTTTLKHICSNMITTTALDYGKTVINGKKVHFFCSSGHERFKFMQEVLCKNINGAILIIDNNKGFTENDEEMIDFIKEKKVAYVIFANKQDLDDKIQINKKINKMKSPLIPTVATTGQGINNGLNILLALIDQKNPFKENKIEVLAE